MDGFLEFLSNTPLAKILFLVGIALVVLGLIRKIPLGKERAIEIESESRRIALVVGLVFVVGAIILDPSLRGGGGNNGPTPTPTETVVPPTSTITPTASHTPTLETATATEGPNVLNQTVIAYYGLLNKQAYKEAWDLLSPEFQQTRQPNGIVGFEEYWRTVDEVEIVEFEPAYVSSSGGTGEVVVGLIYHLEDTSPNVRLRLCLVFDDFQGGWLIDRAVGIDDQC